MAEIAATRSAALALADERALMRQGYQFLDEKRMLLAAAMLRALREHQALESGLLEQQRLARSALHDALLRHGLEALQGYASAGPPLHGPALTRTGLLGVLLLALTREPLAARGIDEAIDASPEARACAAAFAALLAPLARLAVSAGNLERLATEYRRTERRARALEHVLLPEIETALKAIGEHLELADQEEAVRILMAARRR